ncbi:MAG: hypothetical protein WC532_07500 [Candidatus Omnitrophota bacterium]
MKMAIPDKQQFPRFFIFAACLSFLLVYFLICFPLKDWGSYPAADDYPLFFTMTRQGLDILKQGGYFGWDSSFLGGYFTASEFGTNLSLFILPVSFIGLPQGFHLILLLGFLAVPLLCYYYVKINLRVDRDKSLIALPLAAFFATHYFKQILRTGAVSTFIGIDLIILSLIMAARLKDNKKYSFFLLALVMTLLFYTHLSVFLYGVIFIFIDFIFSPNKKYFKQLCYLAAVVFVTSLPFLAYALQYRGYFILDNYLYFPNKIIPPDYLAVVSGQFFDLLRSFFNLKAWAWDEQFWVLIVALYMLNKKPWIKPAVSTLAVIIILKIFQTWGFFLITSRAYYIITISFLAILLTGFLIIGYEKKRFVFSIITAAVFIMFYDPFVAPRRIMHYAPGKIYNQPLVEKIKTLEGRYIAVENNQHGDMTKIVIPNSHWMALLQLETGKLFFSNFHDGYHHTPWRANSLESGSFRGKPINEWAVEDINRIFCRWGVRYLVVWDALSKAYFSVNPRVFEKIWEDEDWIIFKVRDSDTRSAVVYDNGSAEIIDKDFYAKEIILSGVKQGAKVVLRSNYFPAWRAYYKNKEIRLIDVDGQAGFLAPDSGNYVVTMKFPRYALLNILALSALGFSGFLSYKRILP